MTDEEKQELASIVTELSFQSTQYITRQYLRRLLVIQNDIAIRLMETSGRVEGMHNAARELLIAALKEE